MTDKTKKPKFKVGEKVIIRKPYKWVKDNKGVAGMITEISPKKEQGNLYWVKLIKASDSDSHFRYSNKEGYWDEKERLFFEEELKGIDDAEYNAIIL